MSIYSLTPQDFSLQGDTLTTSVQGYCFVMFITQNCKFCHQFMPQFRTLPNKTPGITYAVCSVDGAGSQIHKWSLQSSSPIKAAPTFIFYNNGIPFAEYKGPRTAQNVIAFIQGAVGECQQRGMSMQQTQISALQSPQVPQTQQLRTREMPVSQQRQMPQIQPTQSLQAPPGLPSQPQHQQQKWTISPTTGVKEYESSYGRPYNTANEAEFLDYEAAYLAK